jgi:hypothetical protein
LGTRGWIEGVGGESGGIRAGDEDIVVRKMVVPCRLGSMSARMS